MNKLIIFIGTICALLWGFITAITFGIPDFWCKTIDQISFHLMSREIFKMSNGFYYDVSNNDMPTIIFLILFGIIFALVFFLVCRVEKHSSKKPPLKLIIFFSILFRVIILPSELIHENDMYRYIWDGKTTLHKINPYKYAPADIFMYEHGFTDDYYDSDKEVTIKGKVFNASDEQNLTKLLQLRDQNPILYERIGHWEVPTIYPPITQILFTIPVLFNGNSLILMKFFFVLFDIGSFFLIISLLKYLKVNPCLSIVYGWSPLVLVEISNGGHYDSIPIFLTLLSLLLYFKGRQKEGACFLAFATLSKFFSGVLLPILLKPFRVRHVFLFAGIITFFYLPFIVWDQTGIKGIFQGFITYNQQWFYNDSIFTLIRVILKKTSSHLTLSLMPAKIIAGCVYLTILAVLIVKRSKGDLDTLHKCFLAIALLFIINPVADPWYFCWVIPFLCFFPYKSWYLLSGLLMLSYLNFHSDIGTVEMQFLGISLIRWLTYAPFFLYLAIECLWKPKFIQNGFQP